jgi:peptidoglycan hydrolase-like protein with peptidoglycan-binding domain
LQNAIAVLAACLACSASFGADADVTKKPIHHTAASVRKKTAAAGHSKNSHTNSSLTKRSGTAHRTPAQTWRTRQTEPTPDRYKEIQEALAQKGYLHAEPTGKWDEASSEALRRFQQDQSLEPNGKLNSLSLIALGLGPNHAAAAGPHPALPQPPP